MTDMVEGVARAIVERRHGVGAALHGENLADARAAIAAMREPTEGMTDAGATSEDTMMGSSHHCAKMTYRAMIDAALSDGSHDEPRSVST